MLAEGVDIVGFADGAAGDQDFVGADAQQPRPSFGPLDGDVVEAAAEAVDFRAGRLVVSLPGLRPTSNGDERQRMPAAHGLRHRHPHLARKRPRRPDMPRQSAMPLRHAGSINTFRYKAVTVQPLPQSAWKS